jgi:hypothetical protein
VVALQRLPSMILTLRNMSLWAPRANNTQYRFGRMGSSVSILMNLGWLSVVGGAKTISSRGGIDCINEQFCQKRLLQIRNAANIKGLLASGLVIDGGHEYDGQIPA